MKILQDEGFCTCCGNYSEYNYGDENYSMVTKDLNNYNKYKDVYVYKCPNCNFISTDITGVEGVIFGQVRNSLEYRNALSYADYHGLDQLLYNKHSSEVPANLYEAYAFICLASKDYEKYIRIVNKAIELNQLMLRKYTRSQDELGGEEENDDQYDKLYGLIKANIKTHCEQIGFYFTQIERPSFFAKMLYIENLCKLDKKEEAQALFNKISKKTLMQADLKNYFLQKIN